MKKALLLTLLLLATLTRADEGMWMLSHVDPRTAALMHELGLQLTPEELYSETSGTSLKDAVVDFGDFCSGVIVSPQGLVFTNHHCGFGNIQALSTTEHDYLKDGFVSHSFAEELPAEGLFVRLLQKTEDITPRFATFIERDDADAIDSLCEAVEAEYTAKNPDLYYSVQPYYGGNAYYISTYKVYNDIRLVFTPTQTLGKFGGDTDNWMWPRQTCDFSVFRIYADKDGNPAPYSADNVPLRPKRYAQVSIDGFQQGDYCMTIGYPGSTSRYLSSYGIEETMTQENAPRVDVRGRKQEIWKRWMNSDRAIYIKYASKFANSSNYWKNSIGMNKALRELNVVDEKRRTEAQIEAWYRQDGRREARFDSMLVHLRRAYADRRDTYRALNYFNETYSGIELTSLAGLAEKIVEDSDSVSRAKSIAKWNEKVKDYDPRVDEEVMAALLENYANKVVTTYQPTALDTVRVLYDGDYKAYAHDVFAQTRLTRPDALTWLLQQNDSTLALDAALRYRNDAMATGALPITADLLDVDSIITRGERLLTQAILEKDIDQPHYSDANFSMRLSYGLIKDYTAAGTHYDYYTTSASLLKKVDTGKDNDDYAMETSIADLLRRGKFGRYADKRTGDLQLCFLSTNDITGGNSGSPMFNGRGQLIGLAFDGNWEAMSGDILFDARLQRCIGVDIRFVLYLIDQWGHADRLIKELGL